MVILGCWTMAFESHGQPPHLYEVIDEVKENISCLDTELDGESGNPTAKLSQSTAQWFRYILNLDAHIISTQIRSQT